MDFTRKAQWVLDGHKMPSPIGSTYAGVVLHESVWIAFTYAALNGVDVCAADTQNAYLEAPFSQKHYIICGPEFGLENVGKAALIDWVLYVGKTAGRDFRNHHRTCMQHLDFQSCPVDPDVWMCLAIEMMVMNFMNMFYYTLMMPLLMVNSQRICYVMRLENTSLSKKQAWDLQDLLTTCI